MTFWVATNFEAQPVLSPSTSLCRLTSCTRGHCLFSVLKLCQPPLPPLPESHRCASFTALSALFMDDVCLPGCWPLFHFLSASATNYISIFGSLFFTTLHYSSVILINSVKEEGLQGLLSSQVHFKNNQASHFLHFCSSKVLPFHPLAYLYIFFSDSPSLSDLPPPHHPPSPE